MTRHSKNNTSSSVFTYAERSKLLYGSVEKRHTRDTVKEHDACYLCFLTAIDPVCCSEGHVSCRECVLSTLLSQKYASKESELKEIARINKINGVKAEEARMEAVKREKNFILASQGGVPMDNPTKLDAYQSLSSCSFWIPEKIPTASLLLENGSKKKTITKSTLCNGGSSPHSITLRSLTALKYSYSTSSTKKDKICPGCFHSLNNNMQLIGSLLDILL